MQKTVVTSDARSPMQPAPALPPELAHTYRDCPLARTASGIPYFKLSDDFIAWLEIANAGMLNRGNLLCMDWAIRNLPTKNPIVEIGSFAGLSTNLLTYFKRCHGKTNTLFTCDKWMFEGAEQSAAEIPGSGVTHWQFRQFVRQSYIHNVQTFSRESLPHTIEAFSDEFFSRWERNEFATDVFSRPVKLGGPISFCYIDGNHTYDFARADFQSTDRYLDVGGFILFDDSADGSHWEVTRVVKEVKRLPNYRVVVKNPNYLFQKIA